MPHTSRKKRGGPTIPVQKRLQVTDDDGWTHITSGGNVRRVVRSTAQSANAGARGVNNNDHDSQDNGDSYDMTSSDTENDEVPVYLLPAEAPSGLTEEALQRDFDTHRRTWETSETCQALLEKLGELRRDLCGSKTILDSHVQEDSGLSSSLLLESLASTDLYLDAIVCIGLGSPSGFLRGGRIDRRTVSLYQLAALVSIKKQLSQHRPDKNTPIPVYAQDPVFNTFDRTLLESLGIKIMQHPEAFKNITRNTAVYSPFAEWKHMKRLLSFNPRVVFTMIPNQSDAHARSYFERFTARRMPGFIPHEEAIWGLTLFWKPDDDDDLRYEY